MSSPTAQEAREWVPLIHAARVAGLTPYSVKTAVAAGHIRVQLIKGFPARYSAVDAATLRATLRGT